MTPEGPPTHLEWLLIFAFPNGGSTAIAKLLLTAEGTMALNEQIEGQWLVPAMSQPRIRWNPESTLDLDDIRSRWLMAARDRVERLSVDTQRPLIIEKSPPNMCRYEKIVSMLAGMKTYSVVMSRDPYATCASWHVRVGFENIDRNWGWPADRPSDERSYFKALGNIWLQRAGYLSRIRAQAVHWMRYEDFAAQPSNVVSKLADKIPLLRNVNSEASISVKDYPSQKVRNMNDEQVSALSQSQRKSIYSALADNPELVEYFGYELTPP
jgi:hypothetical protein